MPTLPCKGKPAYNILAPGCCHKPKAPPMPGIDIGALATASFPDELIVKDRSVPTGGFSVKPRKSQPNANFPSSDTNTCDGELPGVVSILASGTAVSAPSAFIWKTV